MKNKSLSKNGISTTVEKGQEQYSTFVAGAFRGKLYYQYDYRDFDGELFTTVSQSLEECRKKRDEWIDKKPQ